MKQLTLPTLCALVCVSGTALAGPIFGDNTPPQDEKKGETAGWTEHVRPGFGARVGGYGFRDPSGETNEWSDCRMNGFGVFVTADATRHLFGEAAVDFYQATQDTLQAGMDRESRHLLLAAGLRMFPDFVFTPYVQLGGGAEWTRLSIGEGHNERIFGMGFVGIGGELNVTRELKLGANLRLLATAQPAHEEAHSNVAGTALSQQALNGDSHHSTALRLGVASQGQIFVRYAL